jgi:hypothetical protein
MRSLRAVLIAAVVVGALARPVLALSITYDFEEPRRWQDPIVQLVVADAVEEWKHIYCKQIIVNITFTISDLGTSLGRTLNCLEENGLPSSADVQINERLLGQYYWDPTPGDITDDAGRLSRTPDAANSIDAASVLKHEIFHAIGFMRAYSEFNKRKKQDGDLDGDGQNEWFLDYDNKDNNYSPGDLVLHDGGTAHTDDGFYSHGESRLMGLPGFGVGEQARPTMLEIESLHAVYDYPVCIPEPVTMVGLLFGLSGLGTYIRRRQAA